MHFRDMFEGKKVKYLHLRHMENGIPYNMGGLTVAFVEEEDGFVTRYAVARCSNKDNFSRSTGREISRSRLGIMNPDNSVILSSDERITANQFIIDCKESWEWLS